MLSVEESLGQRNDAEIPLKYLSIGLWKKRSGEHAKLTALILHGARKFIFLLDKTAAPTVSRRGIKRVLRHLTAHSPFQSSQAKANLIIAFEVAWQHVVGIDYSNPLCLPGRVVLESRNVVKREFLTMSGVMEAYKPALMAARETEHAHTNGDVSNPRTPTAQDTEAQDLSASYGPAAETMSPRAWVRSDTSYQGLERSYSKKRKVLEELSPPLTSPPIGTAHSENGFLSGHSMQLLPADSPALCEQPSVACATASATFDYRSITFNFDSPHVPAALQPVIQEDERLLKLYESGLPAWSIYAPQYGLWYRPWMRSVTYALFIMVSAFSLVMGFYDLYKNVPYLDEVLRQFGNTYFPVFAIRTWLDQHVSFRLSILFAYLFGKSELAVQLLKWLGAAGNVFRALLEPLNVYFRPFDLAVRAVLKHSWAQAGSAAFALWQGGRTVGYTVFGPPFALLAEAVNLLYQSCLPVLQVVASLILAVVTGPWALIKLLGTLLSAWGSLFVQLAQGLGQAVVMSWNSLKLGLQVAPSVAGSAKDVSSQVSGWYSLLRFEALEVVKNSTVKVIKALQTLARLCTQIAGDIARHRLTLQLRMRRKWSYAKGRATAAVPAWALSLWKAIRLQWSHVTGNQQTDAASLVAVESSSGKERKCLRQPVTDGEHLHDEASPGAARQDDGKRDVGPGCSDKYGQSTSIPVPKVLDGSAKIKQQ